jgi:hypothetical protein
MNLLGHKKRNGALADLSPLVPQIFTIVMRHKTSQTRALPTIKNMNMKICKRGG